MEPSFRSLDDPRNRIDAISDKNRVKLAIFVTIPALIFVAIVALTTPRATPWRIAPEGLHIDRPLWHDFTPKVDLDLDAARAVDFAVDPGLRPVHRVMGEAGLGYSAGTFRLANGREVELHLAREPRAILIPRRNSLPLLVGIDGPAAFLAQARAAWQPNR